VETRHFRHRELFETPIDEGECFPPNRRRELADAMLAAGRVRVDACAIRETRNSKNLKTPEGKVLREVIYRDWTVTGSAGEHAEAEIVVNDNGRIIFGRCQCDFFKEHILARGPCEHMIALLLASDGARVDLPSSRPTKIPTPQQMAMGSMGGMEAEDAEEEE
jgi:hypothetical protein